MDEDPKAGSNRSERALFLLERIAELLRVDPAHFFTPEAERNVSEADTTELLRIFRTIGDPDLRRSVLAMLRNLEQGENGSGSS